MDKKNFLDLMSLETKYISEMTNLVNNRLNELDKMGNNKENADSCVLNELKNKLQSFYAQHNIIVNFVRDCTDTNVQSITLNPREFARLVDDVAHFIVNLEDNHAEDYKGCHCEMYNDTKKEFIDRYFKK